MDRTLLILILFPSAFQYSLFPSVQLLHSVVPPHCPHRHLLRSLLPLRFVQGVSLELPNFQITNGSTTSEAYHFTESGGIPRFPALKVFTSPFSRYSPTICFFLPSPWLAHLSFSGAMNSMILQENKMESAAFLGWKIVSLILLCCALNLGQGRI